MFFLKKNIVKRKIDLIGKEVKKMKKIQGSKFLSRKFILAIVAALVIFLNKAFDLELNEVEILGIVGSLLSFVIVEGVADIKER